MISNKFYFMLLWSLALQAGAQPVTKAGEYMKTGTPPANIHSKVKQMMKTATCSNLILPCGYGPVFKLSERYCSTLAPVVGVQNAGWASEPGSGTGNPAPEGWAPALSGSMMPVAGLFSVLLA